MTARTALLILSSCLTALAGCDQEARMSEQGFRLPDGDAAAGREAFLYMQCHQCHYIEGVQLPVIPNQPAPYIELGGEVSKVKTYGELVTAIINPSHRLAHGYARDVVAVDGESKMYNYNAHMTVKELTDIVMYLQPMYEVQVPEYYYRIYPAH